MLIFINNPIYYSLRMPLGASVFFSVSFFVTIFFLIFDLIFKLTYLRSLKTDLHFFALNISNVPTNWFCEEEISNHNYKRKFSTLKSFQNAHWEIYRNRRYILFHQENNIFVLWILISIWVFLRKKVANYC